MTTQYYVYCMSNWDEGTINITLTTQKVNFLVNLKFKGTVIIIIIAGILHLGNKVVIVKLLQLVQ